MKTPLLLAHVRDIMVLPFTVLVIVPYFIVDPDQPMTDHALLLTIIGTMLIIPGVVLFVYSVILFNNIAKGTLAPWSPKQKLVVSGPYRYCRNPMITGVLFMLTAEAFILNSANIMMWAIAFFFINTFYFVISEEPRLEQKFGEDYKRYKAHVPRWIPRLTAYHQDQNVG